MARGIIVDVPSLPSPSSILSNAEARRIALAAQGFAAVRPVGVPTRRHLQRTLSRTQLLQLDSVNVAVRAHYAPLFSRLGAYPVELLDDAAWAHSARKPRLLVEYWAHEASLIPVEDWPLLRWRMRQFRENPGQYWQAAACDPILQADVLAAVKELGPSSADVVERALGVQVKRPKQTWWDRSEVKKTCEWLFAIGELTSATRNGFKRQYELTERVLPSEVYGTPEIDEHVAVQQLTTKAAVALGIATESDLRDYYRIPPQRFRGVVAELIEEGILEPVNVSGWKQQAYRHVNARTPRRVNSQALLCPFDPLIWERERTERLFDFRYRIEIYVPEHKRTHGYYVFPFLFGESLVARVDLKADRATGALLVPGAFAESGVNRAQVAAALAEELRTMAEWLRLDRVSVGERGDLAARLRTLLR